MRTMQRCRGASVVYSWSVSFLGHSEHDGPFSYIGFVGIALKLTQGICKELDALEAAE